MSRLLPLLAAGGAPDPDPRPATNDPVLESMRPGGRRIGLITVGPSGDYATLAEAATAASALQASTMSSEGTAIKSPNHRVDILVAPGTYNERPSLPTWTAWYATDDTPGSTVVSYSIPVDGAVGGALGTLASNGALYWEGIDVHLEKDDANPNDWPKYPVHHVGLDTSIYARCELRAWSDAEASWPPIGMDGKPAGTTLFYQVTLGSGPTNMHGDLDYDATVPETMIYVECSSASTLNYDALVAGAADHLWVVDCEAGSVHLAGAASTLHISGSTVSGSTTAPGQDADADWPVPTGGMSAATRSYYGLPPA